MELNSTISWLESACIVNSDDRESTLVKLLGSTGLSRLPVNTTGHKTGTEHSLQDWQSQVWRQMIQHRGDLQCRWPVLWLGGWDDMAGRDRSEAVGKLSDSGSRWKWHVKPIYFHILFIYLFRPEMIVRRQTKIVLVNMILFVSSLN